MKCIGPVERLSLASIEKRVSRCPLMEPSRLLKAGLHCPLSSSQRTLFDTMSCPFRKFHPAWIRIVRALSR
jgi:hypothetical protein